jgi:hypothetical protein
MSFQKAGYQVHVVNTERQAALEEQGPRTGMELIWCRISRRITVTLGSPTSEARRP